MRFTDGQIFAAKMVSIPEIWPYNRRRAALSCCSFRKRLANPTERTLYLCRSMETFPLSHQNGQAFGKTNCRGSRTAGETDTEMHSLREDTMTSNTSTRRSSAIRLRRWVPTLLLAVLLIAVAPHSILAQTGQGSITGRVTDPKGALVRGATVVITNTETNVQNTTKTN